MAEVLMGVSGGIAAYKSIDVLRILQRRGHGVTVVMTSAARRFVGPATFAALSGRPVGVSLFGRDEVPGYDHLELARAADILAVVPASANTLARCAAGLGDGLLGSIHLAFDGPVLMAPAMNTRMYLHPATEHNIGVLRERGVHFVAPGSGLLADGDVGVGRLAEPAAIADAIDELLHASGSLAGRRVLISAGGTREPIDSVRYVGNRSSGRMGWALAEAAHRRGAQVTVLAANVDLPRRPGIRYLETSTAAELLAAARAEFASCDLLVMAAAVADFRPEASLEGKIDKSAGETLDLHLVATTDIVAELAAARQAQVVVGFAAEHGEAGIERARAKRKRKGLDLIVHNDISAPGIGFGAERNQITIIGPGGDRTLGPSGKDACAAAILDAAAPLLPARGA